MLRCILMPPTASRIAHMPFSRLEEVLNCCCLGALPLFPDSIPSSTCMRYANSCRKKVWFQGDTWSHIYFKLLARNTKHTLCRLKLSNAWEPWPLDIPLNASVCIVWLHNADKVNAEVVEAGCVIELPFLKGRDKIAGTDLFVLVEKEGA